MDGYAVARAFRAAERLRDAYLVALSGYARPADRRRAAEAGFNQHFAKPSSLTGLARLVAEAPSGRP
jgi:CheY-like chemotaxis protein